MQRPLPPSCARWACATCATSDSCSAAPPSMPARAHKPGGPGSAGSPESGESTLMETINDDQDLELDPQLEGDRRPRGRKNGRGENIPDVVIRRLPIYARTLEYLLAEGMVHLSSEDLGERIEVSAAQIR